MIIVDASVLVTALGDDGVDGRRTRARLSGERLVAPEVIDLEVVSAWRRLRRAGQLDNDRVEAALADLEAIRLDRVSHLTLLRRCWELRENLTIYDAAYVALAERLAGTLLTADGHLAQAPGSRCDIELIA